MATLAFSTIGGAVGASIGGPAGASIGQTIGALGGGLIDRALFAPSERTPPATSTGDIHIQTSTEGASIAQIFGTMRVSGEIIWATPFEKHQGSSGQGKGGRGSSSSESYYTVSVAIGLGLGKMDSIRRIWADGQPFNLATTTSRFYGGTQTQQPDPLIERLENFAPAYRGLAYILFENLDLSPFGNRLPQFSFEVTRQAEKVTHRIRAVTIIPGATEFGYHPVQHTRHHGFSTVLTENQNNDLGKTDWNASLDQLEESCPNCKAVSLVVAWFGSSLDAGACLIKPKVITRSRSNSPHNWFVGGMSRRSADVVSHVNGRPAFGGTPSDHSVVAAIRDLRNRGYQVMFHPFLMMDIPPHFPWRGYISTGSANGTAAATDIVNRFFGRVSLANFSVDETSETVRFTGDPAIWSLRRFIFHYAYLCKLAGGVDSFLIGSELGGVTRAYSGPGHYQAVNRLRGTARLVKEVLPTAKISYGANWDEYRGHDLPGRPDFYFHLDKLWGDENVDFVGINYYMPLADWRDGSPNKDQSEGRADSIYDLNYLQNNIKGGEGYDWYYQNKDHRDRQQRTSITDGAYNKSWIYRWKDIGSWWRNEHYDRPNGVEASTSTEWRAGMKPIWFTETGCAAVDKSANEPNVFIDLSSLSSSSSGRPHYSSGARDDYMQNRYLEAILTAFDPGHPGHLDDFNVKIGNTRMLSPDNMFIWCWDARPYPYFPDRRDVWSDGVNWAQGHWITGRASYATVPDVVSQLMDAHQFSLYNSGDLRFHIKGFRVDRISAVRDMLEPLMRFYFFDAVERDGKIHFIHRDKEPVAVLTADECVASEDGAPGYQLIRKQETELPKAVKLIYTREGEGYHQAVAEARRLTGASSYVAEARLPIVASQAEALAAAQSWLHETLIAREHALLRLPLSRLALEPGDVITFIGSDQHRRNMRITSIRDELVRIVEAVCVESSVYRGAFAPPPPPEPSALMQAETIMPSAPRIARRLSAPEIYGPPYVEMMDLPHLRGDESLAPHIAIYAAPRPDRFAVYRSISGEYGWQRNAIISAQPVIGVMETAPDIGPQGCWDRHNHFRVRMLHGELMSRTQQDVLAGANYAAIKHQQGWEIIQFQNAELTRGSDPDHHYYNISGLLRALAGTDGEMRQPIDLNAAFVLLDPSQIVQLNLTPAERGVSYHWRIGPASAPYSDSAYLPFEYRYRGINLRPLSPVHLRARRRDHGDIALSWIRRTRDLTNDGWDAQTVPLGEASEAYEIDVIKNGAVVRRLDVTAPRAVYTAAQQQQDFTTPIRQIHLRIYQISASFGRGTAKEETLYV